MWSGFTDWCMIGVFFFSWVGGGCQGCQPISYMRPGLKQKGTERGSLFWTRDESEGREGVEGWGAGQTQVHPLCCSIHTLIPSLRACLLWAVYLQRLFDQTPRFANFPQRTSSVCPQRRSCSRHWAQTPLTDRCQQFNVIFFFKADHSFFVKPPFNLTGGKNKKIGLLGTLWLNLNACV